MKKKRLLLVTYYHPLANSIASRRWRDMIPFLASDYELCLFTPSLEKESPSSSNDAFRSLINHFYESPKTFMTPQVQISDHQKSTKQWLRFIRLWVRPMATLDQSWFTWFWPNRHHFTRFLDDCKPDLIITSSGPFSSILFGRLSQKKYPHIPWLVDFRDPASLSHFIDAKKYSWHCRFDQMIDRYFTKNMAAFISVGQLWCDRLTSFYQKQGFLVRNGFDSKVSVPLSNSPSSGKKIIYYAGKIYPHRMAAFCCFLDALKRAPNYHCHFRFIGSAPEKKVLLAHVQSRNLSAQFSLLEPASFATVQNDCAKADCLLLLESLQSDIISRGTLTGKFYEYLPYNAPILAIAHQDSELRLLLKESQRGHLCHCQDSIFNFLLQLPSKKQIRASSLAAFSRQQQAETLKKHLKTFIN